MRLDQAINLMYQIDFSRRGFDDSTFIIIKALCKNDVINNKDFILILISEMLNKNIKNEQKNFFFVVELSMNHESMNVFR